VRRPDPAAPAAEARVVCAQALALMRATTGQQLGVLRLLSGAAELPVGTVESVLVEATRARESERQARRDLPALGTATWLLGSVALTLATLALLALWHAWNVRSDPWWPALPIASGAWFFAFTILRWGVIPRYAARVDRRDLRFAQSVVGLLLIALGIAAVTGGWRLGSSLDERLAIVVLVFPGVFGTAVLLLARYRVTPGWASDLLSITSDAKGLSAAIARRLRRDPPERS
jgi:hypothetical protein